MKVIEIIKNLSKVDRNRLKKFLESPYINPNNKLLSIYESIDEAIRKNKNVSKLEIWTIAFGKTKFDDLKLRKLVTDLTALINRFFAFEFLSSDPVTLSNFSMRHALNKNISQIAELNSRIIEKKLSESPSHSFNSLINKITYLKNREDLKTDFEKKQLAQKNKHLTDNLVHLNKLLDQLYIQEKLKVACAFENFNSALNYDERISFENEVIILAQAMSNKDHIGIDVHLKTFKSYRSKEDQLDAHKILSMLGSYAAHFSESETQDIYEHWLNQIIRLVNSGLHVYEETLFKLFQFGLNNQLLYEHGKITPSLYRNIALTASRLKEYDWALKFVEEYKSQLLTEYMETAYSFNKARILGNMKRYTELVETLRNVEYEDLTYNLNSKLFLMISYYELDEIQVLDSFIKSFKVFLRRRRNIPKARKEAFYGFTNVLSNIIKSEERFDPKRLKSARAELSANPAIPNSTWLLEKIVEVEKTLKVDPVKA